MSFGISYCLSKDISFFLCHYNMYLKGLASILGLGFAGDGLGLHLH
jgi:hypothetical protein